MLYSLPPSSRLYWAYSLITNLVVVNWCFLIGWNGGTLVAAKIRRSLFIKAKNHISHEVAYHNMDWCCRNPNSWQGAEIGLQNSSCTWLRSLCWLLAGGFPWASDPKDSKVEATMPLWFTPRNQYKHFVFC